MTGCHIPFIIFAPYPIIFHMPEIYAFGETVYDIIFKDGQPVAAKAGGAMLNSAVSLGRCGDPVALITEMGADRVGDIVRKFLADNGVETNYIKPYENARTPVSLAFLDSEGSASYTFYKEYPAIRLENELPVLQKKDVILFGSYYSLQHAIRHKIREFIETGMKAGAFIIYDPNIRKNHLDEIRHLTKEVEWNMAAATLIRGSREDFGNLFGFTAPEEIFAKVREYGCRYLIVTDAEGAYLRSDRVSFFIPSLKVDVVSTIGAGDSFNAGVIHALISRGSHAPDAEGMKETDWRRVMETGLEFAADCCASFDNYISIGFGKDVSERIRDI